MIENKTLSETVFYYVKPDGSTANQCRIGTSDPIKPGDTGSWSYILYAKDFERGIPDPSNTSILEYLFNRSNSYNEDIPMTKKEEEITRGSIITFGKWHMKTKSDMESIERIVLDIEDDMALLISRYGIDCQPYNTIDQPITWGECTLREWLNNEFLMNAFNKDEQDMIAMSHVLAKRNSEYPEIEPGEDTEDKVFLLNVEEAARYFPNNEVRQCKPTEYAVKNNASIGSAGSCWWWLRSPGRDSDYAAYVRVHGSLDFRGYWVYYSYSVVRPSLRIYFET